MLSSKLALGPSKAMKFLKHLLPQAHFLYVQNFQISTEFYWKLNAFQCFQGDKIFEGGIIITTLNWVKVSQPGRSTKCFPVFHCGGFFHNIFPEIHKFFSNWLSTEVALIVNLKNREEKVEKQWVTRFDIGDIQHCGGSYLKRSVQHPKRLRPTSKLPSTGR